MVQMPALNTPQFGWVKSRLPRKAQPVPHLAPEIGARAIVWAASHRRREIYVGWPTVKPSSANSFPSLLDHLSPGPATSTTDRRILGKPHNLGRRSLRRVPAEGDSPEREQKRSLQLWTTLHRNTIAAADALLGLAGLNWFRKMPNAAERASGNRISIRYR